MSTTEASLNAVYSDGQMNTTVYHLHSVLVHQGQASGGHYWCYIRKPPSLHVETTPTPQATPSSAEASDPPKLSRTVSNSEAVMNSPAMSTESGGGGGGGGRREGRGEDVQVVSGEEEEEKKRGERPHGARDSGKKKSEEKGEMWLKFNDVRRARSWMGRR